MAAGGPENLGEFAPKDVVAPRSDGVPRTAKYQAVTRRREGGHDVLVLISEVWGGFSPEASNGTFEGTCLSFFL